MNQHNTDILKAIQGGLVVSCQALPDEPLHSSFIMGRMARAAKWGGAKGIRANTVEDINEIQKEVDLPVIGIIKRVYGDCPVFITPTMKEIDELTVKTYQAVKELEEAIHNNQDKDEILAAKYHCEVILPKMEALRKPLDILETKVPKSFWKLPTYEDLLF